MINNLNHLKTVLSVPTRTGKEDRLISYICKWLDDNDIEYYLDLHRNIYATKGNTDEYYPCVVAHTDTVHNPLEAIEVVETQLPNYLNENKLSLKGYNLEGNATGIGGDDKCGVYAALRMLKHIPVLKAAFFVSEENGCNGSRYSDDTFFSNVGYAIQYDSPEGNTTSETLMSEPLFNRKSIFGKTVVGLLDRNIPEMQYCSHPYTDVYCLKVKYEIECVNLPAAYYKYHTKNEYVVVDELFNNIKLGIKLIRKMGNNKYYFEAKTTFRFKNEHILY